MCILLTTTSLPAFVISKKTKQIRPARMYEESPWRNIMFVLWTRPVKWLCFCLSQTLVVAGTPQRNRRLYPFRFVLPGSKIRRSAAPVFYQRPFVVLRVDWIRLPLGLDTVCWLTALHWARWAGDKCSLSLGCGWDIASRQGGTSR